MLFFEIFVKGLVDNLEDIRYPAIDKESAHCYFRSIKKVGGPQRIVNYSSYLGGTIFISNLLALKT